MGLLPREEHGGKGKGKKTGSARFRDWGTKLARVWEDFGFARVDFQSFLEEVMRVCESGGAMSEQSDGAPQPEHHCIEMIKELDSIHRRGQAVSAQRQTALNS